VTEPAAHRQLPAEPRQPVAPPHERGEGGRGGHDVGGQRNVEDDGVHPAASPPPAGRSWASDGVDRR
jgi:hypothetical protein